jgi:hypothetical protein
MEKPQIKLQWDRQTSNRPHETSTLSSDTRESLPVLQGRTQREETGGWISALFRRNASGNKVKILAPLLLATVTGVLLGVCLLLLFRSQSAEPTVTTVQPTSAPTHSAAASKVQGAAQLPGQTLWTWQLASFKDQPAAQKAQQEFATKGIHATMRQIGSTYQLLIGVAADKKSGAALETVLKNMKIGYYAKEYPIEARSGFISGLKDGEAKTLTDGLAKETKLATDTMQQAQQEKPNATAVAALKQRGDSLLSEEKGWHNTLVQAGLYGEAAQLDTMHKQLTDSITALQTPGNLLNAQSKLAAFYVDFESLSGQLVKSE